MPYCRSLLMFKLILTLFGCNKAPKVTTTSSALGPFTLEKIVTTGTTFNLNSGRAAYTNISYDLKYKGEPIRLGDKLEVNTGLPGIWRIFQLQDAPQPALVVGSQSLYLITEEQGKAVIKPLFEQNYDFASLQWLDSEDGQPGVFTEIYSSDELDTSMTLAGGRYLSICHAVVLDVKTLELYPYNTNNEPIDGYNMAPNYALAFSPDRTQVVFGGLKQRTDDYTKYDLALLCYDFQHGTPYAVPFDAGKMYLGDISKISYDWFLDYFEWAKNKDGGLKLQLKKLDRAPFRKGRLVCQRYHGYQYQIEPVQEAMMFELAKYVRDELHLTEAQMKHDKQEYSNKITFEYEGGSFTLQHGYYGTDLVLRQEDEGRNSDANKALMTRLGKGFNALLNEGKFQDLFVE